MVWCLWFEASGIKDELERLSGADAAPPLLGEDGAGGPGTRRPVSPAPPDAAWGGDGAEGAVALAGAGLHVASELPLIDRP